jgi:pimeloyl-ACP methyl ester carboxylesterase
VPPSLSTRAGRRITGIATLKATWVALAVYAATSLANAALPAGVSCKVSTPAAKTPAQKGTENLLWGRWEAFEERDVQLDGLAAPEPSTRYHLLMKRPGTQAATNKPLVVFLHGFPEFSWSWEGWLKQFGAEQDSIALDLKAFGNSARPTALGAYDIQRLAGELDNVIQCMGYQQAIVIGHDWGGTLAWHYAFQHAEHLKALVILSTPHPYTYAREAADPQSEQRQRAHYIELIKANTPQSTLAFLSEQSKIKVPSSTFYKGARFNRLFSANMNTSAKWDRMFSYYRALDYPPKPEQFPAQPTAPSLKAYAVNVPTLAIRSSNDPYFSLKSWDGVDAFVPQLDLRTVDSTAHFIEHDLPEVPAMVLDFVRQVQQP